MIQTAKKRLSECPAKEVTRRAVDLSAERISLANCSGRLRKDLALAGTLFCALLAASLATTLLSLSSLGVVTRDDLPVVAATILMTDCVGTAIGIGLIWILARRAFERSAAMAEPLREAADATGTTALRNASRKDPLTGLIDQNALLAFAEDAIPYFRRYRRSVSLLMIEVDAYQTVDGVSPFIADTILCHVAEILDLAVRKTDKVARYDANRFVVLLREINETDTLILANRIREAVSDLSVRLAEGSLSVTVSIGAALVSEHDMVNETLIKRAAMALEASKTNGGNRVIFQPASEPTIRETAG